MTPIAPHVRLKEEGNAALRRGDAHGALEAWRRALALKPDYADAAYNIGVVLNAIGERAQAADAYAAVLGMDPRHAEAATNLGSLRLEEGRAAEAHALFTRALAVDPDLFPARVNLGSAARRLGRIDEARAAFDAALALAPEEPTTRVMRGELRLLQGDLAGGFADTELRLAGPPPSGLRGDPWRGEPLAGRTLLVYPEEGVGTVLQFARWFPEVRARGGRVLAVVPRPLASLFATSPDVDAVAADGDPLPGDYQVWAPGMSLPAILRADAVPPPLRLRPPVGDLPPPLLGAKGRRVGLAWAGDPESERDVPLDALATLAELDGISLFGLQPADRAAALRRTGIADLSPWDRDLLDTARHIRALDLVITADTAIAQLAGTLGVPTWVLVPFAPHWRWGLGREDSAWYPSARVFRQERAGEWAPVIERVRSALG